MTPHPPEIIRMTDALTDIGEALHAEADHTRLETVLYAVYNDPRIPEAWLADILTTWQLTD
jgi:hypothetical protein